MQIESWFDIGGASPKGAKVQVFRTDGTVLSEGQLDTNGMFVFSSPDSEALRVEISASGGHRKELLIPGGQIQSPGDNTATPRSFADRSPRVTVADVLTGVAFVLALAAFVLSVRNGRRLRELNERLDHQPPNGPG